MLNHRIKEQRLISRKTQEDIAKILNVQRATYGQYETGTNHPPIDKLIKLADVFGVSLDYLTCRENENLIDVCDTIEHIINNLKVGKDNLMFNNESVNDKTRELLSCTLEGALQITKIAIKD